MGFFYRIIKFFKNIFGFGHSEIEQKAQNFCQENKKGLSREDILNLSAEIAITSNDKEFEDPFTQIRNEIIESILKKYEKAKIHPIIQFIIVNKKKLAGESKINLDVIFQSLHLQNINSTSEEVLKIESLQKKSATAIIKLKELKKKYYKEKL